jgi:2-polyprenyl-6-methoxyphenol hydroxylase-like FAD-dependent oxidoreductase
MVFLGLSATRWMDSYSEMKHEFNRISLHNAWMETFKHSGERVVEAMRIEDRIHVQGFDPKTPPGTFQLRPLLYQMMLIQVGKVGIQVEFGQKVVEYYEDVEVGKGGVVMKGGIKHEADLVIAADGVGSKSRVLSGGQVRVISSGRAMWRAVFPVEHLDANPRVKEFFSMVNGHDPVVKTWLGYGVLYASADYSVRLAQGHCYKLLTFSKTRSICIDAHEAGRDGLGLES